MPVCRALLCFFQAEDGIRDIGVTGVQTCALPIYRRNRPFRPEGIMGFRKRAAEKRDSDRFGRQVNGDWHSMEDGGMTAPPYASGPRKLDASQAVGRVTHSSLMAYRGHATLTTLIAGKKHHSQCSMLCGEVAAWHPRPSLHSLETTIGASSLFFQCWC